MGLSAALNTLGDSRELGHPHSTPGRRPVVGISITVRALPLRCWISGYLMAASVIYNTNVSRVHQAQLAAVHLPPFHNALRTITPLGLRSVRNSCGQHNRVARKVILWRLSQNPSRPRPRYWLLPVWCDCRPSQRPASISPAAGAGCMSDGCSMSSAVPVSGECCARGPACLSRLSIVVGHYGARDSALISAPSPLYRMM